MSRLIQSCTTDPGDILLGDFNLHHPSWSNPTLWGRSSKDAATLADGTRNNGMTLVTTPGEITYSAGTDKAVRASTIDLTFLGRNLAPYFGDWGVVKVRGFESDHCVCQTRLNVGVKMETAPRFRWHKVRKDDFRQKLNQRLGVLDGLQALDTWEDIESYVSSLVDILEDVIVKTFEWFDTFSPEPLSKCDRDPPANPDYPASAPPASKTNSYRANMTRISEQRPRGHLHLAPWCQ
ncbi:hypothetical protein F4778DRAFT_660496 [Xylariomycetidae sp. FL2044]|nr:hypothetical protein F4778DRAFT_660496 [Xylariomycetidae sp. FL2044]